jgi:hydroxymethylbilane synthase
MSRKIIIGSRGSDLALWQANFTKDKLQALGFEVEILIIKTQGDIIQHLSFDKMEGKGFFTKELEEALLNKKIDLAVHSHKDLPTTYPDGLTIAGVSYREDCSETILISKEAYDPSQLLSVHMHARFGTSSVRRSSQLHFFRPDLNVEQLRGNVPTRVQKLRDEQYDAIMLASAGLQRLNLDLSDFVVEKLDPRWFIPAPAQGVLAYQIREDDAEMQAVIAQINDEKVAQQIWIERRTLNQLDGGCQLPLGVYVEQDNETLRVWSSLKPLNGAPLKRFYLEGNDPALLSESLIQGFNTELKGKIFISRDEQQCKTFIRLLEGMGFHVNAKSLIRTEALPFEINETFDWVFFTSANAVMHFIEEVESRFIPEKIAVIGPGTANALKTFGLKADFIGDPSKSTADIGIQFAELYPNTKVLFPQSDKAMQYVTDAVSKACNVSRIVVYSTLSDKHKSIPEADVYVFTSPSNVNAFIEAKGLPDVHCVAIGSTTFDALKAEGVEKIHTAPSSDMLALADITAGVMVEQMFQKQNF